MSVTGGTDKRTRLHIVEHHAAVRGNEVDACPAIYIDFFNKQYAGIEMRNRVRSVAQCILCE